MRGDESRQKLVGLFVLGLLEQRRQQAVNSLSAHLFFSFS
jgi:hypothetical protein